MRATRRCVDTDGTAHRDGVCLVWADGKARSQLESDGYCVIGSVLSREEVSHVCIMPAEIEARAGQGQRAAPLPANGVPMNATQTLDLAWDWVEAASTAQVGSGAVLGGRGVRREDRGTWDDERWPRGVEGGILPYLGGSYGSGC